MSEHRKLNVRLNVTTAAAIWTS